MRWVTYDDVTEKFTVNVKDLTTDEVTTSEFDYVFVACGHYSTPITPEFPGLSKFLGRTLHSHDFRSADEFAGKDVLCVGSSYSAEDIGIQCHKYGAKSVTFSWRTKPMGFKWPEGCEEVPLLERVEGKTCYFKNGYKKDVDAIVLCTGYLNHFPFMEELAASQIAQPPLSAEHLQRPLLVDKSQAHLHRHAGSVLHLQYVRCPGVVRAGRDIRIA